MSNELPVEPLAHSEQEAAAVLVIDASRCRHRATVSLCRLDPGLDGVIDHRDRLVRCVTRRDATGQIRDLDGPTPILVEIHGGAAFSESLRAAPGPR
jgi:hypothetical protein